MYRDEDWMLDADRDDHYDEYGEDGPQYSDCEICGEEFLAEDRLVCPSCDNAVCVECSTEIVMNGMSHDICESCAELLDI
jgi:hypothetical protein